MRGILTFLFLFLLVGPVASQEERREKEKVKRMSDGFGTKCVEFARYSDQDGFFLKTSQGFCQQVMFEESCSERFCETWPRSGTMRNGVCYRAAPWDSHTHEKECSFCPTPKASDGERGGSLNRKGHTRNLNDAIKERIGGSGRFHPMMSEQLMGFPLGFTDLEASETQ